VKIIAFKIIGKLSDEKADGIFLLNRFQEEFLLPLLIP